MLLSVVPRFATDSAVRVFPGVWTLLSFLRLPSQDGAPVCSLAYGEAWSTVLSHFGEGGGNACQVVYLWKTKCSLTNVQKPEISKMFATMLLIIAEH